MWNAFSPGFELISPCPFPTTITITPRAPPMNKQWLAMFYLRNTNNINIINPSLLTFKMFIHCHFLWNSFENMHQTSCFFYHAIRWNTLVMSQQNDKSYCRSSLFTRIPIYLWCNVTVFQWTVLQVCLLSESKSSFLVHLPRDTNTKYYPVVIVCWLLIIGIDIKRRVSCALCVTSSFPFSFSRYYCCYCHECLII